MAIVLNGSSQSGELASAPATAAPLTISAWARPASDHRGAVFSIGNSSTNDEYFSLLLDGISGGDPATLWRRSGGGAPDTCNTSTGFTVGDWHHVCGVVRSATDASCFIDGGSEGTSATSKAPSGVDQCTVGVTRGLSAAGWFEGRVAEVAVWTTDLSDAEVSALAAGVAAWTVSAADLTYYAPLLGTPQELVGQTSLTETNSPTYNEHPPSLPFRFLWRGWQQPGPVAPSGDLGADVRALLDRWGGWRQVGT